jgi:hypothetical protein
MDGSGHTSPETLRRSPEWRQAVTEMAALGMGKELTRAWRHSAER